MLNHYEESLIKNSRLPAQWQSQSALDELADFLQQNWEQRAVFYDDGQITTRQQFLAFSGQRGIRTQNYIGTISFKGHQLNIFPKVFRTERNDDDTGDLTTKHLMHNLVQWLQYCRVMDYPYIQIKSQLEDSHDLRELFVTLYVRYVKNALDRGVFYQYEERTADCSAIKGRVDFKDYLLRKYPGGQHDKFRCTYSNFEFDNMLNRILKYTCKSLVNSVSGENQKIIRHILMKLNEVSDVRCSPYDCDKVRLTRFHKHYAIVLSMSKVLLLNKSTSFTAGNVESFCFLFPTEVLFEGFIGGFMHDVLEGKAKVKLQASDMTVFSDVVYAGKSFGKSHKMRHDILIEQQGKTLVVLDTKYKQVDRFEGNPDLKAVVDNEIRSDDIYQVITYAHTRGLSDVYLLYPMYRFEDIEPDAPIGIHTTVNEDAPIHVHLVRLPFVFEDDVEATKQKLTKVIKDIVA